MHLHGYVDNRNDGVFVMIQATPSQKDDFVKGLTTHKPDVAEIETVTVLEKPVSKPLPDFFIAPSREVDNHITRISPDIAVCDECLQDLISQPHRIRYPFINCTHCGPRRELQCRYSGCVRNAKLNIPMFGIAVFMHSLLLVTIAGHIIICL